ncbi:DcaP family trimeric outer membrane transporter [Marinobacter sp. X15-166B]|uniref:DcaP family trimeric outer membrane transporter n=1 Tax=Marinobacter sp. X15-166B TaxID=1897620 RepID=UPI00085C7068|nr:DcaP family trimeric outer membrane transporter [Marinobacter sp. X15-166B]OEY66126.1 hypothetical protein BG841_06405 [Marinobacter sp. X15-166B]
MRINKNRLVLGVSAYSVALMLSGAAHAVSWEVGDTKVDLYGYVKLDATYDVDAYLGPAVLRSNIRYDGVDGSDGHLNFHANQSRIGTKTTTPMAHGGPLTTVIEFDFYGDALGKETSSQKLRLRHAYASWNGLLAGQTTSNFGPENAYMPTLDFYGQAGGPNGRVPQIRYTMDKFSVSLEDPEVAGGGTPLDAAGDDSKSDLPNLTAAYNGRTDNLRYVVAGIARKLVYYDASTNNDESAFGWGALVQAAYNFPGTGTTVRAGVTHGDGIGKAIYFNFHQPTYYDPATQSLETITATGFKTSISQQVGPGAINLGYNRLENDVDDAVAAGVMSADSTDEVQTSVYLNYIWSPVKRIRYGVEVAHHTRETVSGRKGDATRLQGSLQYFF